MPIVISVPKLSATMEEAKVLRWLKQPGEPVCEGDVLLELETDKTALEVEATAGGTLVEQKAQEGDTVPVGGALGVLDDAGAAAPADLAGKAEAAPDRPAAEAPSAERAAAEASGVEPATGLARPKPFSGERIMATPLARRLARQQGVDLASIAGAGSGSRITSRDIAAAGRAALAAAGPDQPSTSALAAAGAGAEGLSSMRRAIAAQVSESRRTIPSFTLGRWVELDIAEAFRSRFNHRIGRAERLTLTDFIVQALADVLPKHPRLMSLWHDGDTPRIETLDRVNVGLAVAAGDGLMIPVLKDLAGKGLQAVAERRRQAISSVRAGKVGGDVSGQATITVSNVGRDGADRFEAIINPGESAVLAVGRLREQVVAERGTMRIAKGADLTLSVDHRLIDGMAGSAFLGALADRIGSETWRL